jgi:putative flippase GtrA
MKLSAPRKTPAEFLRFAVAGAIGFVVDTVTLLAMVQGAGWAPLPARAVSIAVAIVSTWMINRGWAFRDASAGKNLRAIGAEFLGYCGVQLLGAATNFAVYSGIVALGATSPLALTAAVAAGSISAMLINYFGARLLVFRSKA